MRCVNNDGFRSKFQNRSFHCFQVLVATSDKIESYQPVEWFYHQDQNVVQTFVSISTASNRSLSVTPNHLLTFVPCNRKLIELSELDDLVNYESVFASKAKPGLCLAIRTSSQHFEPDLIISVSQEIKRGVFSPITTQGTIIVNDIQVSCYSSVESHFLQYGMHKFLIQLRNMINWAKKIIFPWHTNTLVQRDIPSVVLFFIEIAQVVVPSLVYV